MQTFSGMQRSFPYQDIVNRFVLVAVFLVYISLSSMYLFLPPMLAVLFFVYYQALSRHDLLALIFAAAMLLIFEAEKGFWFGSTLLFFALLIRYLIPKIEQVVQCRLCRAAIFVALAYPGYWLFVWIADSVLLMSVPAADWHMALYMVVEFLILAALI